MNATSLTFSIIICTCERPADLLSTVESIRQTDIPGRMSGELIVVDNSCKEDTRKALSKLPEIPHLPLRVMHEQRHGKAYALNTGIARALGKVLLFTDDDLRVPPNWIETTICPILKGEADAVVGGIRLAPGLLRPWMGQLHRCWMASTESLNPLEPESLFGANMAFARTVLERVPIFDPELGPGSDLGSCEDSLFSFQLREAGCRIASVFQTSVDHHFDPTRLARKYFLQRAKVEGRCAAYILHHWHHGTIQTPYRTLLSMWLKLMIKYPYYRWKWTSPDGAPERELQYLINIHQILQYLRERRRPRKYAKHGLIKLGAELHPGAA